jgi:hypothetical protein
MMEMMETISRRRSRLELMRLPFRSTMVLVLLVALLVTGLVPAVGSWSCPDGTACVYSHERGFHCLGEQCVASCCVRARPIHGCGRCDHGAVPNTLAAPVSHQRTLDEAAHCRYQAAPRAEVARVTEAASPDFWWHTAATLPAPTPAPVTTRPFVWLAPVRGSPAVSPTHTPSSPRAPPGLNCA